MSWKKAFEKKWIELSDLKKWKCNEKFFNQCVLVGKSDSGEFLGFSIFEPRDIQQGFAQKLLDRYNSSEDLAEFDLYVPEFLSHRIQTLFNAKEFLFLKTSITPFVEVKASLNQFSIRSKLRVVNVDDSQVLLKFLSHSFNESSWMEVVGQVQDSTNAVSTICDLNPDLVTLDIQMPDLNGVQVLKNLLAKQYFPVLMISSVNLEVGSLVFDALNSGAFDYIQKPRLEDRASFKEELFTKALLAIEGRNAQESLKKFKASSASSQKLSSPAQYPPNLVWCIGSSTGGTQALTEVFRSLPTEIPPTLVVQHIPPIFSKAFANSLNALCPFEVKEAEQGDVLLPNHVYIAPGGQQMSVEKVGTEYKIVISDDAPVNRFKPSVDYLFLRMAQLTELKYVGGILTGMGKDGAEGLLALKKIGARTFAQDEASSSVYGMPRAAFELGAVDTVCPLYEIAQTLLEKSSSISKPKKAA